MFKVHAHCIPIAFCSNSHRLLTEFPLLCHYPATFKRPSQYFVGVLNGTYEGVSSASSILKGDAPIRLANRNTLKLLSVFKQTNSITESDFKWTCCRARFRAIMKRKNGCQFGVNGKCRSWRRMPVFRKCVVISMLFYFFLKIFFVIDTKIVCSTTIHTIFGHIKKSKATAKA